MTKIQPIILKGTRDFLPMDMAKRNLVMNRIRNIFAKFGYDEIETPILCPAETILGKYGDEGTKLTYNFETKGETRIALPYDLTVPFARLVAANWQELPMPFKRYQIQRVWRAEKPQKGRLREFYQCDIDIIGTKSLISEAEIAKIIVTVFEELGFQKFKIKINSRRLLNDILKSFNVPEDKILETIRIIDKLAKIGEQNTIETLKEIQIENAVDILKLLKPEANNEETFKKLSKYDLSELQTFFKYCEEFKISNQYLEFDPSLARGLDYYTGISFEVIEEGLDFGTLCAGGRYDNLCSLFCNENFSGVGVAFGFERIMLALEQMKKLDSVSLNSQVLITLFDENSTKDALNIYDELTQAGIKCEIYFEPAKLNKQFKYADKKKIQFVVLRGSEEIAKDEVSIKVLNTGKQKNIPRKQLISYLKGYITN